MSEFYCMWCGADFDSSDDVCEDCEKCVVKCVNELNLTENIQRARELFA